MVTSTGQEATTKKTPTGPMGTTTNGQTGMAMQPKLCHIVGGEIPRATCPPSGRDVAAQECRGKGKITTLSEKISGTNRPAQKESMSPRSTEVMYFYIIASLTFLLVSGCCQDARLTWESFPFFDRGRVVFSAKDDHFFNLKSERISGTGDYIRGAIVLPSVGGDENVQQTAANNGVIIANGGPDRDQFLQLQLGNDEPSVPPWVMWRYARALGIDEPSVPPCAKWRGIKALGNDEPSAPPWGVIVADKGADRDVPGNDEPSAPPWVTWRCVRGFGGRDVGLSWRFQQNKFVAPPWLMIFVFSMPKKGVHARSPADETTRVGPPFGRRSVLGYDQSGHIPNANRRNKPKPRRPLLRRWRKKKRSPSRPPKNLLLARPQTIRRLLVRLQPKKLLARPRIGKRLLLRMRQRNKPLARLRTNIRLPTRLHTLLERPPTKRQRTQHKNRQRVQPTTNRQPVSPPTNRQRI